MLAFMMIYFHQHYSPVIKTSHANGEVYQVTQQELLFTFAAIYFTLMAQETTHTLTRTQSPCCKYLFVHSAP